MLLLLMTACITWDAASCGPGTQLDGDTCVIDPDWQPADDTEATGDTDTTGATGDTEPEDTEPVDTADPDGDGWGSGLDCGPTDPDIHPFAAETSYDDVDSDCDGTVHHRQLMSGGGKHACLIQEDATLRCWGDDTYGQATPPEGTFTQVAAGYEHTCGLRTDGTVTCWGDNGDGESDAPDGTYVWLDVAYWNSCAIDPDGVPVCWGLSGVVDDEPVPDGTFVRVEVGGQYMCALAADGTPSCWGNYGWPSHIMPKAPALDLFLLDSDGCIIDHTGAFSCTGSMSEMPTTTGWRAVEYRYGHGFLRDADGTWTPWGYQGDGELDLHPDWEPDLIATGSGFTCLLTTSGELQCVGADDYGQSSP